MIKIKIVALAVAAVASVALAACGSSSPAHQSSPAAPAPSSSAAPSPSAALLTCDFVSGEIHTALRHLRADIRHYQEAWVSGGHKADLRALIIVTAGAVSGANQLNDDAAALNQDASSYLSDNSPYLAPGWQSSYRTVNQDIRALAADCG